MPFLLVAEKAYVKVDLSGEIIPLLKGNLLCRLQEIKHTGKIMCKKFEEGKKCP